MRYRVKCSFSLRHEKCISDEFKENACFGVFENILTSGGNGFTKCMIQRLSPVTARNGRAGLFHYEEID
jgi:hypothetical protein